MNVRELLSLENKVALITGGVGLYGLPMTTRLIRL